MDIGYAVFKGIVQGLGEFLPISSTAHLVFTDAVMRRLGMPTPGHAEEEFFDILLHVGTLVAVVIYFRRELMAIFRLWLGRANGQDEALSSQYASTLPLKQLPVYLAVSVVMTVVLVKGVLAVSEPICQQLGLVQQGIHDLSEYYFHHPRFVALHLIITGFLLFGTQKFSDRLLARRDGALKPVGMKNAVVIGLFQGCAAIFHGISRSGSTISGGLLSGLDRVSATRYSFLLSLPTFVLVTAYEGYKFSKTANLAEYNWPAALAGSAVAGLVGYYCVKYFLQYLAKNPLTPFAVYCWVMGAVMMVMLG
ncbi:MAG: undecaprenyl-diphosphate phosphatase [Candidatus Melainabacteria bacterium]